MRSQQARPVQRDFRMYRQYFWLAGSEKAIIAGKFLLYISAQILSGLGRGLLTLWREFSPILGEVLTYQKNLQTSRIAASQKKDSIWQYLLKRLFEALSKSWSEISQDFSVGISDSLAYLGSIQRNRPNDQLFIEKIRQAISSMVQVFLNKKGLPNRKLRHETRYCIGVLAEICNMVYIIRQQYPEINEIVLTDCIERVLGKYDPSLSDEGFEKFRPPHDLPGVPIESYEKFLSGMLDLIGVRPLGITQLRQFQRTMEGIYGRTWVLISLPMDILVEQINNAILQSWDLLGVQKYPLIPPKAHTSYQGPGEAGFGAPPASDQSFFSGPTQES